MLTVFAHPVTSLPTNLSLALAVACRDVDVRNVKALIIGPHETPYEFGFFEVCRVSLPGRPITVERLKETVHFQVQQRSACSVAKYVGNHQSSNVSPSADYPRKSPSVNAITTNGGRCRFNPNIYAQGRVCL
jgi:ubiquitin-conjugating enzyme E2 Z